MMLTLLAMVLIGVSIAYGRILPIFMANRWLNGLIVAVFAAGVLTCFWQVAQLVRSVSWIEHFASHRKNAIERGVSPRSQVDDGNAAPRLLAPLAAMLGSRGPVGGSISTGSARSILDSVAQRIDELRDITRYLTNLLIFLGLLGTFYGLAVTIPAIVETIRALTPEEGETGVQVFEKLMGGLESQLGGMATAFSSSLLGLSGSLVVGLLELFVTHGQNRFYRELEEWMSGFTSVSLADETGGDLDHAAMAGFLEQMAAQMVRLQQYHAERDAARDDSAALADERIIIMAEALEAMVQRTQAEREASLAQVAALNDTMNRLVEGQNHMIALGQQAGTRPAPPDLSGVEDALHRLTVDLGKGRDEMLSDLRTDLLVLTRAVRAARFNDPFRDDLLPETPVGRGRS
nr:Spy/CpxP family protein refolding chaperone [Paracoccus amoyensis]